MAKLTDIDLKGLTKKVNEISTKVDKIEQLTKEEEKMESPKEEKKESVKEEKKEEKKEETPKETKNITKKSKNPFVSDECIDILNFRIEQEEQSSRIYEAMSLWLNDNGFKGAAKRWKQDSLDELKHASWAKEFLLAMGIQPKLSTLKEPKQEFEGLLDIVMQSYDHEIVITEQCNDLAKHAMEYSNHLLYQLAIKYLQEQQEELEKIDDILSRLNLVDKSDKLAMIILDQEIGDGKI